MRHLSALDVLAHTTNEPRAVRYTARVQQSEGDQVFTGADTFDFGTTRQQAERMLRPGRPFAVVSHEPGATPFVATGEGQRWLAGAVIAAYWAAPVAGALKRRRRRRNNASRG